MSGLRRFCLRLLHALRPQAGDAAAAREYHAHLALLEDDLRQRGLTPAEARRQARAALGQATAVVAAHRDARTLPWLLDAAADLRHAARLLRRTPAHTGAVLLTVALVVAAASASAALVHGVLIRPLPYPDADRLVRVWEGHEGTTQAFTGAYLSALTYHALRDAGLPLLTDIGAFEHRSHTLTLPDGSERLDGAAISPSVAGVLGLDAALGRFFLESEAEHPASPVVVLSDGLWRRRFGARPDVLGTTLVLDGVSREIVGVAPATLAFPAADTAVLTPLHLERPEGNTLSISSVVARLAPGATPAQVARRATALARATPRPMVADVIFGQGGPVRVDVQRLDAQMTAAVRPALLTIGAAVLLLLVVAVANVANLAVVHGLGRRQEIDVRVALGATRLRLMRQVLVEHLALCGVGALAGVLLGTAVVRALPRWLPASFPRREAVQLDWAFATAAACCVLFVASLATLVTIRAIASRPQPAHPGASSRAVTAGRSPLRHTLLVMEAAIALVLLIGAALLARSFVALLDVDVGYDRTHAVTAVLYAPRTEAADAQRGQPALTATVTAILERLRAHPAVQSAGMGSMVPFGGSLARWGFELNDTIGPDGRPLVARATASVVTDGYVDALRMRMLEGRALRASDRDAATRAMLVNRTFARTYLDDDRPVIGRRYTGMLGGDDTQIEIVGVVDDVLPVALDAQPDAQIYLADGGPFSMRDLALVVRTQPGTTGAATSRMLGDIRAIVAGVDPAIAVDDLGPLEQKLAASVATPRAVMLGLLLFAGLALALAVGGLYGVLAHTVAARARELGIRAALGARRRTLVAMVVREGLRPTIIGLAVGLALAGWLVRLLRSQLFGVQPLDPASFAVAPLVLIVAALLACLVPARRAAASDPAITLRQGG